MRISYWSSDVCSSDLDPLDVDVLVRLDCGKGADAIAVDRGGLELQRIRRTLHVRGQLLLHVVAAPGQEPPRLVDQLGIAFLRDVADAGGAAALDLVLQARTGDRKSTRLNSSH